MSLCQVISIWIREIPGHLKTQEMCNEAVHIEPCSFQFFPDHLKTQKMYNEIMPIDPAAFFCIFDGFKTQEMYEKAVEVTPWQLHYVLYHFKAQQMCYCSEKNPFLLDIYPRLVRKTKRNVV